MRICILTPHEIGPSETFIGAHIENLPHEVVHLYGHALDLSWKGHKIAVSYKEGKAGRGDRWLNLLPRFIEFRIRRRFFPPPADLEIVCDFLCAEKVDVVLAEYGPAAAHIVPACQAAGIPLVAHFHGFDASRYQILDEFVDGYRNLFAYSVSVISVSRAMSKALIELGCPEEKIRYNPCGPDPQFFEVNPDYFSDTLVAVGRHTFKKAPYLTIEAFRRARKSIPGLKLCFIGDGELFEVTKNLVKAHDFEQCVELLGAVTPAVIRQRMAKSFALVQHSITADDGDTEGTPVAILEAGAAGLPVVATTHAGIPDVVVEGQSGFLVPEHDVEAMSNRIALLAGDRALARDMGQKARDHISNNFSMEKHLATLNKILCSAVEKNYETA